MGDPMPLPPPPWVLGSSRGTLEPLGFDATAVVIDRVIELEKSLSPLKVGIIVKLTVRLFMFWGVRLFTFFFYLDPSRALRKTFFFSDQHPRPLRCAYVVSAQIRQSPDEATS